jgi:GTP-binding protein HflX
MDKTDKLIELERPPITETAILARVVLPSDTNEEVEESLEEMRQLAWTAGADIACTTLQRRQKPCPATLVGQGKAEEIKAAVEELGVDVVIFDSDLTPAQGSKLEEMLGVKVVDRTQLILDIFAQRAQTNEGKHQVELAQLQYMLPRLSGRGSIMRQQGGIGVRGPGEQKLEVDRRVIRERIARLQAGIENIRKSRQIQRRKRTEGAVGTVALVGYTNAGKSSLMNRLTNADVFVENKLFATLDPRARRCLLSRRREVVLSDTVGFIRKLPHSLVAAFRATLEEVKEADLLLLVADASHPAVEDHIRAVYDVLEEIESLDKPMIIVLNKTDVAEDDRVSQLLRAGGVRLALSAKTGEGCEELLSTIDVLLSEGRSRVRLRIPQSEAGLLARIYKSGQVHSQEYDGNDIVLDAEIGGELHSVLTDYVS